MPAPLSHRAQLALGFLIAVVGLGAAGELFLRQATPPELDVYLGERSGNRGAFVADPDFAVGYRSWNDLHAENAADLTPWLHEATRRDARPVWVFVGNSFVHGAGMLVDHVRTLVPERYILTLHRTDPVPVRCAQIDLLCARAPPPERIFIPLTTVDLLGLGAQPLATWQVSTAGALTYVPRLPFEPGAWMVRHSRLTAAAWFRTGRHRGNLDFDKHVLDARIDEPLRSDLRTLFAGLARRTRGAVPMTVILIPSYQQLVHDVADGFQQHLRALVQPLGYDVFDPLTILRRQPDRVALFLPDKHFSPRANQLVAEALLEHLRNAGAVPRPQ